MLSFVSPKISNIKQKESNRTRWNRNVVFSFKEEENYKLQCEDKNQLNPTDQKMTSYFRQIALQLADKGQFNERKPSICSAAHAHFFLSLKSFRMLHVRVMIHENPARKKILFQLNLKHKVVMQFD